MTPHQQEQIDNYHSGLMSEKESAAFESDLNADPSLKAESDFQSDIINGLKEYRKAELKIRLESINLGPTWGGFIQQSALVKSMGGVVIASLIGGGIYLYGEKETPQSEQKAVSIDGPIAESLTYDVIELGEENSAVEEQNLVLDKPSLDKPAAETQESAGATTLEEENAVSKEVTIKSDEKAASSDANVAFTPDVAAPDVASIEEGEGFQSSGLDELPENTVIEETNAPIDVKSENRKGAIKYKYYDGKLFLSGDFKKHTYEILEINSASGRRIYVYYLSEYYRVGITDRLIELPKVTNQKMIDELELIRKNK